jgi:hypothetical protein
VEIEELVCSLDLSKKLKELEVKQESYFYYGNEKLITKYNELNCLYKNKEYFTDICLGCCDHPEKIESLYSAFTAGELFELLPAFVDIKKDEPFNGFWFNLIKRSSSNIRYIVNYHCDTMEFNPESIFFNLKVIKPNIYGENLSDCLAQTLIYLIENNLIGVKDFKGKE